MQLVLFILLGHDTYPEEIFCKHVSLVPFYPYFLLKVNPFYPHTQVMFFGCCTKIQIKKNWTSVNDKYKRSLGGVWAPSDSKVLKTESKKGVATILLLWSSLFANAVSIPFDGYVIERDINSGKHKSHPTAVSVTDWAYPNVTEQLSLGTRKLLLFSSHLLTWVCPAHSSQKGPRQVHYFHYVSKLLNLFSSHLWFSRSENTTEGI